MLFGLASYVLLDVSTIHKRTNLSTLQSGKKLGLVPCGCPTEHLK